MRAAALVALGTLCLARPTWRLWHSLRARDWSSAEAVRTHWLMVAALWLSLIPVSLVSLVLFRVAVTRGSDLMLFAAGYFILVVAALAAVATIAMLGMTVWWRLGGANSRRSQISLPSANTRSPWG